MDDGGALRRDIGAVLQEFIASVVLHNHAVATRLGLGASDSQFVQMLLTHGPLTPGRLAEESGLTTGTVTGVVDRLEKAGFVERTRDGADRRRVIVAPTRDGLARLFAEYADHAAALDAVLATRSAEELRTIHAFLRDVVGEDRGDRP